MKIYADRIPRLRMVVNPVNDLFLFLGERAENSVPNYQKFAKVFVEIFKIYAVMNAVMRRRCEDQFDRSPKFRNKFRVMQKRYKKVNAAHHINVKRFEADQREREKEQKRAKTLRNAGAKRYEKIHFFSGVMRRMRRPHYIDAVSPSMHPVKNKIHAEKQKDKRPPIHLDREKPVVFPKVAVDNINAGCDQNIRRLIAERRTEIRDRFGKRNVISPVNKTQSDLQTDKEKGDRR